MISTFAYKVYRKGRNSFGHLARAALNIAPVEKKLQARYAAAKGRHRSKLPPLSPKAQEIVDGLNRHGYYATSLAELDLPNSDQMMQALDAIGNAYHERATGKRLARKAMIMADAGEVVSHPQIFLWGLNQTLLDIVENYLSLPVSYDGMNVFYTVADGKQVSTRRWHLDGEDRRMVKIAVYGNDVDEGGGPFEVVEKDFAQSALSNDFTYSVLSQEQLKEKIASAAPEDNPIRTFNGPKGTMIFCDTALLYHRGRPAETRDRCAIFFNYFSGVPRHPFYCERSGLSRLQIAKLVESVTPVQRASALWREKLPIWAKILPTNIP